MNEHQPQPSGDTPVTTDPGANTDREEAQKTEVRLALVMNGGVSLAVWMGGVTHELDLLRRASRGDDPNGIPDPGEREVFRLWQELTAAEAKRVRIDVIAGTSAGGLNGLLLATAIARNAALPNLREMWRDDASLDALLKPRASHSVLNGDLLEGLVKAALDKIEENPILDGETVTLFITATALAGGFQSHEDGFAQRFDVRDHRRVYRFKNQLKYREKYTRADNGTLWTFQPDEPLRDFASSNEINLLRAARATASYPVAFSPVFEGTLLHHIAGPAHALTQKKEEQCLTDGGVLNNAPFGPVLEEITKRRVDRSPVDRVLVYIVPTAGILPADQVDRPTADQDCSSTPLSTVLSRAVKHPTEADLRSGIEDLRQRLQTSIRGSRDDLFRRIIEETNGGHQSQMLRDAAASLLDDYRRSRARAVVLDVLTKRLSDAPIALISPPYVDTHAIQAVLHQGPNWLPPSDPRELESPRMNEWYWGLSPAQRFIQTVGDYIHNRLRPPLDFDYPELGAPQKEELVKAARTISDQLRRAVLVTNTFFSELENATPPPEGDAEQRAQYASTLVRDIFTKMNIPRIMGEVTSVAANCFNDAIIDHRRDNPGDIVSAFLTVEILTETFAPPNKIVGQLTPNFRFLRLGPDSVGPLFDASQEPTLGDRKLYGTRFNHFGAFIDPEWRRSDFTWGRLDAVHHLLPLLMPGGTPEKEEEIREKEKKFHEAILAAEDLPGASADPPIERMRKRLEILKSGKDLQLLDDDKARSLKETCAAALELVTSGPWRGFSKLLWNWTWAIWRRYRGQGSLPKAAKSAALQLAVGLIGMFVALTIIVMMVMQ